MFAFKWTTGPSDGWELHELEWGCVVVGTCSAGDIEREVIPALNARGYDKLATNLFGLVELPDGVDGPIVVVGTTDDKIVRWEREIDARAAERFPDDPVLAWMHSTGRGLSSMWLVSFLTGVETPDGWDVDGKRYVDGGRCYFPDGVEAFRKCVQAVRQLKLEDKLHRIGRLAGRAPVYFRWANLIPRWAILSRMLDDALAGDVVKERLLKEAIEDIGRLNPNGPRDEMLVFSDGSGGEVRSVFKDVVQFQHYGHLQAWAMLTDEERAGHEPPSLEATEKACRQAVEDTPGLRIEP